VVVKIIASAAMNIILVALFYIRFFSLILHTISILNDFKYDYFRLYVMVFYLALTTSPIVFSELSVSISSRSRKNVKLLRSLVPREHLGKYS